MDNRRFFSELDRRRFLKLMGAAGALVLAGPGLQACAPQAAPAPGKKEVLELKVGAFALKTGIHNISFHVADSKGYFTEAGLKVALADYANPPDAINSIGKDVDIASVSPQNPLNAYRSGMTNVRIIGSVINAALTAFVVPKGSTIKDPKELKGGKIGIIIAGGTCHIAALSMLEGVGIAEKDVSLISGGTPPDLVVAVKTGQMTSTCLFDPLLTQFVQSGEVTPIWTAIDRLKPWMESVAATNTDVIKNKGEALRRLMAALQKAMEFVEQNPDEAGKIWAQASGLPPDVAVAAIKRYPKGTFTTMIVPDSLKNIERMMKEVGIIKKEETVAWSTLVDVSFLPEAQRTKIQ